MKKRSRLFCLVALALFGYGQRSYAFQRPERFPEHALTLSVLPAYNALRFGLPQAQSRGAWDVGAGLSYSYQWNKNWGLSIGINHRSYQGKIDLHGVNDSVHLTEEAGEKYFLYLQFQSTENQKISCLEPFVMLEYSLEIKPWLDFLAGLGLAYAYNYAEEGPSMEGSYKKQAYFYLNDNLIDDLPSMNLGEYTDLLNPLPGKNIANAFMGRLQLGLRWNIAPHWSLLTRANAQYSLNKLRLKNDVLNHHESYSGIVASKTAKDIHSLSCGFEVAIQYRFASPKQNASRPAKGNNCPAYR